MSAELEIVFTDRAGQAVPPPGSPVAPSQPGAGPQPQATPGPQHQITGPFNDRNSNNNSEVDSPSLTDYLERISKGLGFSGLYNQTQQLAVAFSDAYSSIQKFAEEAKGPIVIDSHATPSPGESAFPVPKSTSPPTAPSPNQSVAPQGPKASPTTPTPPKSTAPPSITGPSVSSSKDNSASSAMGSLMSAAGPAATALAGVAAAGVATIVAVKFLADSIHGFAKDIEGYSPDISMASAKNEVRMEQAAMRRAESIGPDLAAFENDYGRFQEQMYDLQTQMFSILLKIYREWQPAIDGLVRGSESIPTLVDVLKAEFSVIVASVTDWTKVDAARKDAFDAWMRWMKGREEDKDDVDDPIMKQLIDHFMSLDKFGQRLPAIPPGGRP